MTTIENKVYFEGNQTPRLDLSPIENKRRMQTTNEVMKEKVKTFREQNPGVFIAIPKVEKTSLDYTCIACGYHGKMNSLKITGYSDFEYVKDGEGVIRRRAYTTPTPSLISCHICGSHYENEDALFRENEE